MSPITTACWPLFLNAAHEVSPIGGVSLTPAAVIERSLRGTDTLNTPSSSLKEPFTPVSSSILAVSREVFGGAAVVTDTTANERTTANARMVAPSYFGVA